MKYLVLFSPEESKKKFRMPSDTIFLHSTLKVNLYITGVVTAKIIRLFMVTNK